MRPEV